MKLLYFTVVFGLGYQVIAQKLEYNSAYVVENKTFIISEKIGESGFMIDNKEGINSEANYKWFILHQGNFDRNQLSDILLDVFPKERIIELQQKDQRNNPAFGMTWHIDRSGNVCAITYRLFKATNIRLKEFSDLEDVIKSEMKVTDFLLPDTEVRDYYTLTFHVRLSKVLDGSFAK